jgi:preprotein translocase subunit SecF
MLHRSAGYSYLQEEWRHYRKADGAAGQRTAMNDTTRMILIALGVTLLVVVLVPLLFMGGMMSGMMGTMMGGMSWVMVALVLLVLLAGVVLLVAGVRHR